MQSDIVKNKTINTIINRYGVTNTFLLDKAIRNRSKSFYNNPNCMCSHSQYKLCKIYNGQLNYQIGRYFADIFLKEYNIVVEYDGSGHDIAVQRGYISKEEFKYKEQERDKYLISLGYKVIRLITKTDAIYSDIIMKKLLEQCISLFRLSNTNILKINIDKYVERETTE